MRRPPVVLGLSFITALALLVALGLILFSVNPGVDKTEDEIQKAVASQHAIICAQVQNTANAYRFRSLTPRGEVEPLRHFLTRMQAQQQTLRLARGSECKSAPGFPPVGLQVRRALDQINRILMSFSPRLREPVRRDTGSTNKQSSFSPRFQKPPDGGVDESGVPARLKDDLAPSEPLTPSEGHHVRKPRGPTPVEPESPVVPKGWVEGEDNPPPPTQVKGIPVLPPELPVDAEISTEEELKINVEVGGSE